MIICLNILDLYTHGLISCRDGSWQAYAILTTYFLAPRQCKKVNVKICEFGDVAYFRRTIWNHVFLFVEAQNFLRLLDCQWIQGIKWLWLPQDHQGCEERSRAHHRLWQRILGGQKSGEQAMNICKTKEGHFKMSGNMRMDIPSLGSRVLHMTLAFFFHCQDFEGCWCWAMLSLANPFDWKKLELGSF